MSYEVLYITILHFIKYIYIYGSPKDKFMAPSLYSSKVPKNWRTIKFLMSINFVVFFFLMRQKFHKDKSIVLFVETIRVLKNIYWRFHKTIIIPCQICCNSIFNITRKKGRCWCAFLTSYITQKWNILRYIKMWL